MVRESLASPQQQDGRLRRIADSVFDFEENISTWIVLNNNKPKQPQLLQDNGIAKLPVTSAGVDEEPKKEKKRIQIVYDYSQPSESTRDNTHGNVRNPQNPMSTDVDPKVKPVTRITYDYDQIKSEILYQTPDRPGNFDGLKYSFDVYKDRPCSLRGIPEDVKIIEVAMPLHLQLRILEAVYGPLKSLPNTPTQPPEIQDIAMALKYYLQMIDGEAWHVVVVIGQFSSFISHEPDRMFHFKVGRYIMLVWKINR